ncbi:MAG: hypothetical protein KY466_08510 [Gemmatimonadetes bacterium]|nr:hypothetical protein [Gemmatimonadota bacterium]
MPTRSPLILSLFFGVGCAGGDPGGDTGEGAASGETESRPAAMTDTLMIEGSPQPLALRLFRTDDDFPLPFSAYVPEDMTRASEGDDEDGASVRFVAEFGGVRNERALVHLFVHPVGTDPQQALAVVRAYEAAAGVPVSRGIEPLGESETLRRMPWADHAYVFRYQASGTWYLGTIGLGSHAGRLYHLVVHYPAEYGDGFGPRAAILLDTWRWGDGSPLQHGTGASDITIPSARPDTAP